ncbi:hypothetical protein TWF730_003062 [Orbilia blumenaviensis]|uniref:Uncharacterized protein n=1 Tax=Orbilia blumenaviensis TaxID=1796055 RepID=A0AAV9U7V4_9PEZI
MLPTKKVYSGVDVGEREPLLPIYRSEESFEPLELEIHGEIQNYYYGSPYDRDASRWNWKKYFLPLVYTVTLSTATLLHRHILTESRMPYFLMAVYNTTATAVSLSCIGYNSYRETSVQREMTVSDDETFIERKDRATNHWKPFAFIFLYMASEEGFWFSLNSMDMVRRGLVYLTYPMFVAIFTWEWVFSGRRDRVLKGVNREEVNRLKITAAAGLLGICWSYMTSVEWWVCVVAVAGAGFKNVVTRDIFMTSQHHASELVMLASSALSFRALMSCYGSPEYSLVWPQLREVSWLLAGKVLGVGVCYGISQLVLVEILRIWEPVRGSWTAMGPAVVAVLSGLALDI